MGFVNVWQSYGSPDWDTSRCFMMDEIRFYYSVEGRGEWRQGKGRWEGARGKEGNRGVTWAKKKIQIQVEIMAGGWAYAEWIWF